MDSAYFKSKGISVTCGDLAIEHAKLCQENHLSACVTDLCELGFKNKTFDAVWAVQCLFHIPKSVLPKALESIQRVLKPGGLFYITVGGGKNQEEVWEDDYFNPPRFFGFRSDKTIKKTLSERFEILSFETHPTRQKDQHQQIILLQKAN